jgi:hypothetical protein
MFVVRNIIDRDVGAYNPPPWQWTSGRKGQASTGLKCLHGLSSETQAQELLTELWQSRFVRQPRLKQCTYVVSTGDRMGYRTPCRNGAPHNKGATMMAAPYQGTSGCKKAGIMNSDCVAADDA